MVLRPQITGLIEGDRLFRERKGRSPLFWAYFRSSYAARLFQIVDWVLEIAASA